MAAGSDQATVAERHAALVAGRLIEDDPAQRDAARLLDGVAASLGKGDGRASLRQLFARRMPPAKGLYLHGDVGRGKTMLMDMFFAAAPVAAKRRLHFNAFMGEIHDRIHAIREAERAGRRDKGDPIVAAAEAFAGETRLLCLDEFAVTDVADAMILSRLFAALFQRGLVLVATSNTAPDDLYRDGLNRPLFLPFVDVLREHAAVVRLADGADYRLAMLSEQPIYLVPADAAAAARLDALWATMTRGAAGERQALRFKGRDIEVPVAAEGAARFGFADLCERPLGANDFLVIARTFHTVFVDGIRVIPAGARDVARRLVLLVDALYDHRVNLVASAEAEPAALYDGPGAVGREFRRTVSRLAEMQSSAYLARPHLCGETGAGAEGTLAPDHQSG